MKTPKPNPYYRTFLEYVAGGAPVTADEVGYDLEVDRKTVLRWIHDLSSRNLVKLSLDGRYEITVPDQARLSRALNDAACGTVGGFSRQEIFERDGWRCTYCGRPLIQGQGDSHPDAATLDHRFPKSEGGWDNLDNLTTACRNCNSQKGKRVGGYGP